MASSDSEPSTGTAQRVLAYVLVSVVILSVASFFAIMIGTWSGMAQSDFGTGFWPVVAMTPYIGLPLAMLVLIALLISGAVSRSRQARRR
ncbi:multidrug ABC transporter ATPase [Microbacterium sp. MPKO10]|uniref:multidrug ABC transporter ATPase n=1 Tax=Microbacterium sp. MPKO10 TaxID=2989818 RepID=UPI002236852B|nr:multidrug ABC transporter ATPase [Microbacterium sp. MPKO10]MCW4458509.1 multidrug ABC transporter ATPase [Microbacterium sp. MPKO10]